MSFLKKFLKVSLSDSSSDYKTTHSFGNFEILEDRQLLAADIQFVNNVIEITGTSENDTVEVSELSNNRVRIVASTANDSNEKTFVVNDNTTIDANLKAGDDRLDNKTGLAITAYGDRGNDVIYGGWNNDILFGAQGNDRLFGRGGDDVIRGNAGDDLVNGGEGNDRINGNEGKDIVRGANGHDEIHGDNGSIAAYNNNHDYPTGEDDRLFGGNGNDRIYGNGGNDLIQGNNGDDWLDGQGGNDRLLGGNGHDSIFGGSGNDVAFGHNGDDLIDGYKGDDQIRGHAGNDDLKGGAGNDRIWGGTGDDELSGGFGNDRLFGEQGTDVLDGSNGDDLLVGGIKTDKNDGGDQLFGGSGNDILRGYYGDDQLEGGIDDDRLEGSFGNDWLRGDDGVDRIFGHGGKDRLEGGGGNDYILGGAADDEIFGGSGDDRLFGQSGNDIIYGNRGNDRLFGDDSGDLNGGDDELHGDEGLDSLFGYYGNDRLFGGDDQDSLKGHQGDDYLLDEAGKNNEMDGGGGNNRIEYLFAPGDLHGTVSNNGKQLRLAGTDKYFSDSGFTLLTTGSNRWVATKNGSAYQYIANGRILLDLDGNGIANANKDLTLTNTGWQLDTFNANSLEESVIDPDSLDIDLLGGPLKRFLESLKDKSGFDIGLPNFTYGISSGQDLMDEDSSLPLRASQPYLHFTVSTNFYLKFGAAKIASPKNEDFKIIVDPTDWFVFVKGKLDGKGGAIGVSDSGRIPFRPKADLDSWDNKMFGHLYIQIDGVPLPSGFSLNGSLVLDLDADDDGVAGFNKDENLEELAPEGAFWQRLENGLDDISVGVNGELFFGKKFTNKVKSSFLKKFVNELKVSTKVLLAEGAIVYDGALKEIHFKGQRTNPFKNTPLEDFDFLKTRMEVSGAITKLDANPQFRISYYDQLGAGQFASRSNEFHLFNNGATFRGRSELLGQSVQMSGSIFSNGTISVNGSGRFEAELVNNESGKFDAGLFLSINGQASISSATLKVDANLDFYANALTYSGDKATGFAASLDLAGVLELGTQANQVSFDVAADFSLYIRGTQYRPVTSFGVSLSENGFGFKAAGKNIGVTW